MPQNLNLKRLTPQERDVLSYMKGRESVTTDDPDFLLWFVNNTYSPRWREDTTKACKDRLRRVLWALWIKKRVYRVKKYIIQDYRQRLSWRWVYFASAQCYRRYLRETQHRR